MRLLFVFHCLTLVFTSLSAQAADRPNVLFIAFDDLRPELGTYGTKLKTPHFDAFAKSGIRFDRAYCQQAVCGASRLSLMGGLYPTRTKEQTFHVDGWRKRNPQLLTLNQHFRARGFTTIGLGKVYHGSGGVGVDKDNWDSWIKLSADEYALDASNAALRSYRETKPSDGHDPAKGPTTELADVPDDTYIDGLRAKTAVTVLKNLARQKEPFFFAVGLSKPHLPFVAPKKYWDLYRREDFSMPPNTGLPPGYPEYAANLPAHEMKRYSDYEGEMPTDFSDEMNRRLLHGYAACVSYADANLGVILSALQQNGLAENTIVVLWGDHGWKLGDHSTWCKHTNFECDTRVPLLMRVPGEEPGRATKRLVELIDLYPTLCELVGIPVPPHCQGRSFVKLIRDPNSGHRYSAYSSYPARREVGHSIRFGDYRYTEWRLNGEKTGKRVLTNLKSDPGEVTNVAKELKHAEALARGEQLLQERIEQAKASTAERRPRSATANSTSSAIPLKRAASGKFKMGVGVGHGVIHRPADVKLLKHHFEMITAENCLKSTVVQKKEGQFDFKRSDALIDFAEQNGIEVVGHCLVWSRPGTTPPWFFKDGEKIVSRELLLQRLKTHIHTVVSRYKGRIAMWDVVNEALADQRDQYLRDIEWSRILGEEFIVKAFQYAREADPDALLIYNDYRCDHPAKLDRLVRLVRSVKAQGGPIDAVGLQAHYEYGMIPYDGIEAALVAMRKLGVKVVFSELDMDVVTRKRWYIDGGKHRDEMRSYNPYAAGCPDDVLDKQAEQYAKLFELICKHSDVVERVTFWNLHDGQTWLNDWPWKRANHPLLFDRRHEPKPAYKAVVEVLTR